MLCIYSGWCSRTVRKIIAKKNVPDNKYCYANFSKRKGGWNYVDNQDTPPAKAQLLISKKWCDNNIPKMRDGSTTTTIIKETLPEAPDIMILDDEEKFHDDKGNAVDIETRGERTADGVYFLANDVANAFERPSISKTILTANKGYKKNNHYKYFNVSSDTVGTDEKKKELFITYKGMLKILFSSRTGKADNFVDWAIYSLNGILAANIKLDEYII